MSRPHFSRNRRFRGPRIRINERIRAREVRVVAAAGKQMGVFKRDEALKKARERQVELVEVIENATIRFAASPISASCPNSCQNIRQ